MKQKHSVFISLSLSVLLLTFSTQGSDTEVKTSQIEWDKSYFPLFGKSIVQTSDGGYILAGQQAVLVKSHSGSRWEEEVAVIIKVGPTGKLEWTKTYGSKDCGGALVSSVAQTVDSGYIISGIQGRQSLPTAVFLIKTNSVGNIEWNKTITSSAGSIVNCKGILTTDENYVIIGTIEGEYPTRFGWIVKTDKNGGILWNRTFASDTVVRAIIETNDGEYVVAGDWKSVCWFAKTDVNGNLQWNQTYDLAFDDEDNQGGIIACIIKAVDGGYVLGGRTNYGFLIKTSSEGVMEWNQHYAISASFGSIVQATDRDGYFGVGGFNNPSRKGAWFIRVDALGDLMWNKTYRTNDISNFAYSVINTDDGGYAVAGTLEDDIWLVKFAPEPSSTSDNNLVFPLTTLDLVLISCAIILVTISFVWIYFSKKNQ